MKDQEKEQSKPVETEDLDKNIGFIAYPKLGHPTPYTRMMEMPKVDIPTRYMTAKNPLPKTGINTKAGAVLYNAATDPKKVLPEHKHKMSGFINTSLGQSGTSLNANSDHEAQHSIFAKIKQQKGKEFAANLIHKTVNILSPFERKLLDGIHPNKGLYKPEDHNEELISRFHNYLQDPTYRDKIHASKKLSESGQRALHNTVKKSWKKMQNHALTLDHETVMKSEEVLEKMKGPPTSFPKLGIYSNNELELVSDPGKLKTKLRTMADVAAKVNYGSLKVADPKDPHKTVPISDASKRHFVQEAVNAADSKHKDIVEGKSTINGQVSAVKPSLGFILSGALRPAPWRPSDEQKKNHDGKIMATKEHEKMHEVFSHVEAKYGRQARRNLAENMFNAIPKQYHSDIDRLQRHFAGDYYDKTSPNTATEEKLARVMNYLNSAENRQNFNYSYDQFHDKTFDMERFHANMKEAHKALLGASGVANEHWLNPNHVKKNEKYSDQAVQQMLGYSHMYESIKRAAKFLYGKGLDDGLLKDKVMLHGNNMIDAFLDAYCIPIDNKSRKALLSVARLQDMSKSELVPFAHNISAVFPEDQELAKELQKSMNAGNIQPIDLNGKHSKGSMLVQDDHGNIWIIKTESGPISPSKGISQEHASASLREGAFWALANHLGIGHSIPVTKSMIFDTKAVAVIRMLDHHEWNNLDTAGYMHGNTPRQALEPYRESGELFKWAIMDYITGNADRHGANLMVSSKESGHKVMLIDHGTTFAGTAFNPLDKDTWTPYYLRIWKSDNWKNMDINEKIRALPRASSEVEQKIAEWLANIDEKYVSAMLQKYSINPDPTVQRLQRIKQSLGKEPIDLTIGKFWLGL